MELKKVKCKTCSFFDGKRCEIKKVKVAKNKNRQCDKFENDLAKVKVRQKLKAEYVPYHETSRKLYKKWVTEEKKKELLEIKKRSTSVLKKCDVLSNFRSSAPEV